VAFDLLAVGDRDLCDAPYAERRKQLEKALKRSSPPVHVTPATQDPEVANDWFSRFEGAGLDGVVAKAGDLHYLQDKRAMLKVKHERTADCVVAGFRWHKDGGIVGSLLLGLFDPDQVLHHVGVASGFTASRRRELVDELEPYRSDATQSHPWMKAATESSRIPGGTSRWSAGKDMSWEPLRPELVCEVSYDHLQEQRFRHGTSFRRWRPDRKPASCTYAQLEAPVPTELALVFDALT
jgi:ATP-dependent DNA ligase